MAPPILSVRHLTTKLCIPEKTITVVDGLSFDLHAGKTLALVGESGSGKTMTALSLLRILPHPPALHPEGEVFYQGKDLLKISEKEMQGLRGARIAMIFQDPASALNPVYTIGDQLIEVAHIHLKVFGKEATNLALSSLQEVGIASPRDRLDEYPHQLSGGMKQRVMIAMALMCQPDVLIADEPTTALDVTIQAQVIELIRQLQAKKGMAVLLITHDMGVVAEMADEVIVMYAAQAVEKGNVVHLFDSMSHPYTQALFASHPRLDQVGGQLQAIKGSAPPATAYPRGCRFHPRCPFVMTQCRQNKVPTFATKDKNHTANCWLLDTQSTEKDT